MTFPKGPSRTLVLVDGEHYPPVVRAAIGELEQNGYDVAAAVLLGGTEKIGAELPDYGVADLVTSESALAALIEGLERHAPEVVFDLSDHPVVDARSRMLLAAHALYRGVRYRGADFVFEPPPRPHVAEKPSIAVIGTAKRSGKTAVSGHLARHLAGSGRMPVVVAMGRGGPEEPEIIDLSEDLSPEHLLALAESGRHAASDHLEDALMARVPTVGTRRAGGGLAGATVSTTFVRGVELANARPEALLVLEGSGAAIPPVDADATVCIVPADADPELVTGYLGAYPLLLADLVVVTLAPQPPKHPVREAAPSVETQILEGRIRELVPETPVVVTTFRPHPLGSISGRTVFFATTAPSEVTDDLVGHLESEHGAEVVGRSSNLANRRRLGDDLDSAPPAEVLVTELKAAAVDVATRAALAAGMEVVYCDNRPVTTGGDGDLDTWLTRVADQAVERFRTP